MGRGPFLFPGVNRGLIKWFGFVHRESASFASRQSRNLRICGTDPVPLDVTYTYDRLGRRTTIADGAGTHVLSYDLDGKLLSETNTAGLLVGHAVTNAYDALRLRSAIALVGDAKTLVNFNYDGASRLMGVSNALSYAGYSYVANSPLISQIAFTNNGSQRMTTIKSFDNLNRLTLITNGAVGGASSESPAFAYPHNAANQRTAITNADGSRWVYEYDSLGQVTSGKKYWSDGTAILGQQFEYTFDDIGNRKTAVSGGDANGTHKRVQYYAANNLNQYSQRTVPGYVDVMGTATNSATVAVNHGSASRKGDYYRREVSVLNSGAVWQSITNTALIVSGTNDIVTNMVGNVFVPKTPELFGYDPDGNQTNDGRWAMTWDGENRLIKMQSLSGAPVGSSNRLTFIYDQQGRRVSKTTEAFVGGAWSITLSNRFIYDGWNLIAEINATNNAVINSFVWGLDLSGTEQGAGGVGGLLVVNATNVGSHFVGFDGNGNVAALVSATSGTARAHYEYDPFGNVLRATGPMALLNPFRFSTKYTDAESAFSYYGYRYYRAQTGRWLSRDPIEERGGKSLYGFVANNSPSQIDFNGLFFGFEWGDPGPDDVQMEIANDCCNSLSGYRTEKQAKAKGIKIDDEQFAGNAILHCVATCRATQSCKEAKRFWDKREPKGTPDGDMDLANNAVGYGIKGDCWKGCADALRNGNLVCLTPKDDLIPCKGNVPPGL